MEFDASSSESSRKNLMNLSGIVILYFFVGATIGTTDGGTNLSLLGGTFHIDGAGLLKLYIFVLILHWYFIWRAFTHFKTTPYWTYIKYINSHDIGNLVSPYNWSSFEGLPTVHTNIVGPTLLAFQDLGRSQLQEITKKTGTLSFPVIEVFPNLAEEYQDTRALISFDPSFHSLLKKSVYWRTPYIADNYIFWLIPSIAVLVLNGNVLIQVLGYLC